MLIRTVYRDANGQPAVAMVEAGVDKVERSVWTRDGQVTKRLIQVDELPGVTKSESVAVPMATPDVVFKLATAVSAKLLERMYERGASPREIDAMGQELAKGCAEAYTIAMHARMPNFPDAAGPKGDPIDPTADPHNAGTPRKKAAHRQPGMADTPHLDEDRMKQVGKKPGPAAIHDGVSKALVEAGFESEGEQGETEIWKHADLGHVVEVETATGEFVAKSGWTPGSCASGEGAEDFEQWMTEEEGERV